jgi:predicted SAM-dependent methyltransferase
LRNDVRPNGAAVRQQLPPGWTWEFTSFIRRPFRFDSLERIAVEPPLDAADLDGLGLRGLQFGCGDRLFPSCLNTDLCSLTDGSIVTGREELFKIDGTSWFVQLNACEPLPLPRRHFEWVYAEHFIEHLTLPEGISWLTQVRRLMAPGGVLRLTTPELRRYLEGYLDPDDRFYARHRERVVDLGLPEMEHRKAWMLNQIFQFYGHRWVYDADELRHALECAGFSAKTFEVCSVGQGSTPGVASLDNEMRNDETIYVEITA